MRIVLEMVGGLGDVLLNYLCPGGDASYLASLKEHAPDAFVQLTVCSTNPHARDIFAHHPHIDQISWHPFDVNYGQCLKVSRGACRRLRKVIRIWQLDRRRTEIFLDPDEASFAHGICGGEPYVCVHPFAGAPERTWVGRVDVVRLLNSLCDAGHRVVVLGGSSNRYEYGQVRPLREELALARPGLINLVNRCTVRLHAYLARRAACFLGSFSAYSAVAAIHRRPTCLVTHPLLQPWFEKAAGAYGAVRRAGATVLFWDDPRCDQLPELLTEFATSCARSGTH